MANTLELLFLKKEKGIDNNKNLKKNSYFRWIAGCKV
jgi:hypothetical protein